MSEYSVCAKALYILVFFALCPGNSYALDEHSNVEHLAGAPSTSQNATTPSTHLNATTPSTSQNATTPSTSQNATAHGLLLNTSLSKSGQGSKFLLKSRNTTSEESRAIDYLTELNKLYSENCFNFVNADWNYQSDITEENGRIKNEIQYSFSKFKKEAAKNVSQFSWRQFQDENIRRQFRYYDNRGFSALSEEKFQQLTKTIDDMEAIYNKAKICSYKDKLSCDLSLTPELTGILSTSTDYKELEHVWVQWREQSGKKMRSLYEKYVELSNEASRLNGYLDTGAYWLNDYETESFKRDVEELWQTLKPFYLQLHAYVRGKLASKYGKDKVPPNRPIPAHLLGNMWAQSWVGVYQYSVPFPGKASIDVTAEMNKQGYTPKKMFEVSDEFFKSLGLLPMPPEFWEKSIIEKIPGREMGCHASAWDFCNGKDFRIKQCTTVDMQDLIVIHHEMGHVQYFLQYKDLPVTYRNGANPGFHEAVGDTLALSVSTPKHLKEIGLLDKALIDDNETSLNFLYFMALDKIAFLPFAYLMDKWRWDVFDGTVQSSDYNCHWWRLREGYQGVKAPVTRTEDDFDPGAKYHIAADVEYLRYFISYVIQFQFHRSLCLAAGQYDPKDPSKPLHNCDIYRSKEAGAKLAAMLSMGSSRPWPEAMHAISGQDKMDASAIREYFKPLEDWLRQKNQENNETIGWVSDGQSCQKLCKTVPPKIVPGKSSGARESLSRWMIVNVMIVAVLMMFY